MVKRYHNKIKEGQTYSACSVIHNTTQLISGFLPFTLICNTSFHQHIHPLCRCIFLTHTHTRTSYKLYALSDSSPLIKHTPNNTIICKTHILLQNTQSHTHSNTGMHTVGFCLSEAVAVGLWSSEARVVGTVAILERNRERRNACVYIQYVSQ